MINIASLSPLAVAIPFLGAALAFVLIKHPRAQRRLTIATLAITLLFEVLVLATVWNSGPVAVHLGGWMPPFGIVLVADQFSSLLLVISSVVSLAVLVYASGQGAADGEEGGPLSVFHPTYLILVAGVSNAFLAGDLFNLYVGFEILLTASYVLMTLGGTGSRIRTGITYVVVSVVSSMLFLIAIAMIYGATGTVTLADLAIKLGQLDPGTQNLLHVLLLVAFGIKAAVFPLSFWLPDSYPTAPAPVTAVFAGLLTKVGVYAIIRTETLLFPGSEFNNVLMWVALLTMIVGILGAVAQTDIKRMLSFTLVSHIGYMIFGVGLSSVLGLAATIFYVIHHITVQTSLFMVTGLIERRGGTSASMRLGGLAKLSPILAILYFIPAMNLAGIPPFSGFLGKLGLLQAGVANGSWLAYTVVIGGVAASLLTLLVMARVWNKVFLRSAADAENPDPVLLATAPDSSGNASMRALKTSKYVTSSEGRFSGYNEVPILPKMMLYSTMALVVVGLALSIFAGPLLELSQHAAESMLARTPYIDAVLGHGAGAAAHIGVGQ